MKASLVLGLVASFCIIGVYSVSGDPARIHTGSSHRQRSRLLLGSALELSGTHQTSSSSSSSSSPGRYLQELKALPRWGQRPKLTSAAAAAAALRRAAALLDGTSADEAEVMMPAPVALPQGFEMESGLLQPDPPSTEAFVGLFSKVPHKGSGVAAGGQHGRQVDSSSSSSDDGVTMLEAGQADSLEAGSQPPAPTPPLANASKDQKKDQGKKDEAKKEQQQPKKDEGKKEQQQPKKDEVKKDQQPKQDDSKKGQEQKKEQEPKKDEGGKKDQQPKKDDSKQASSSNSSIDDGQLAAIPTAAVVEAQQKKSGASSDAPDEVTFIPTDPLAPHTVPYVGGTAPAATVAYTGPSTPLGSGKAVTLASMHDRSSRMETGQHQSSSTKQHMSSAAVAGIVVGVLAGVGCCAAVVVTRRARRARQAATAAAGVTARKQHQIPKRTSLTSEGDSLDDEDVESADAASPRSMAGPPKCLRR